MDGTRVFGEPVSAACPHQAAGACARATLIVEGARTIGRLGARVAVRGLARAREITSTVLGAADG